MFGAFFTDEVREWIWGMDHVQFNWMEEYRYMGFIRDDGAPLRRAFPSESNRPHHSTRD